MYVRLVVTFCSKDKVIMPKEAHIDYMEEDKNYNDTISKILSNCMTILNEKYAKIETMLPAHLRGKDFEIIIHGNYLQGLDWDHSNRKWTMPEPIFNIQQLGLPEENMPLIKSV